MVLLKTHHATRMLDAWRSKSDTSGASVLAHLVRSGWFKPIGEDVRQHDQGRAAGLSWRGDAR